MYKLHEHRRHIDATRISYIYTMEYYSAIKRNNAICSNMDGPREIITLSEVSQRERQISYDITYMWNLKYEHKLIYLRNRLTDIENRLMVSKG